MTLIYGKIYSNEVSVVLPIYPKQVVRALNHQSFCNLSELLITQINLPFLDSNYLTEPRSMRLI